LTKCNYHVYFRTIFGGRRRVNRLGYSQTENSFEDLAKIAIKGIFTTQTIASRATLSPHMFQPGSKCWKVGLLYLYPSSRLPRRAMATVHFLRNAVWTSGIGAENALIWKIYKFSSWLSICQNKARYLLQQCPWSKLCPKYIAPIFPERFFNKNYLLNIFANKSIHLLWL